MVVGWLETSHYSIDPFEGFEGTMGFFGSTWILRTDIGLQLAGRKRFRNMTPVSGDFTTYLLFVAVVLLSALVSVEDAFSLRI